MYSKSLFFNNNLIIKDLQRLVNQTWKLIPMREHNEDWRKQLYSVIIEVRGLHRIFGDQLDFLILLSTLEGLNDEQESPFMEYRAAVFSATSIISEMARQLND